MTVMSLKEDIKPPKWSILSRALRQDPPPFKSKENPALEKKAQLCLINCMTE